VGLNGVWALTWAPNLFCPRYGLVSVISIGPGFVAPSYLITLSFTFFLRIFTFFFGCQDGISSATSRNYFAKKNTDSKKKGKRNNCINFPIMRASSVP
jgi:hypothetical protein